MTLAAAVAATDAVRAVGGFEARVKWPNDLVVDDRKLAGILAEADGAGAVVVGMGLNVRPDAFPAELRDVATACDLHAAEPGRPRRRSWSRGCTRSTRSSTSLDGVVAAAAAAVRDARPAGARRARATSSSPATRRASPPEGYLVVRTPTAPSQTVTAGDVIHLRPTDEPA